MDNGFYLAEMIAPEASPTPVPEEISPTPEVTVTPEASLTPEGGKNEATEAVKESVEDENEGTGDTKDADSKKIRIKSPINRTVIKRMKIQKKVRQRKNWRKNLDKVGCCFRKRGEDINSSLERTELKSRLEEAG